MESIEEVALGIKAAEHKLIGKKMRTADFTTMYTKLPHDRLSMTVKKAWERAVEYKATEMGVHGAAWVLAHDMEKNYNFELANEANAIEGITRESFVELMDFLITENHIWNGGELRRQVVGIPMGSPVSPHMANLFRYVVEAEFVEDLLAKGEKNGK